MIGKKVQDAFNEQIKQEMQSAYLYLSMAAYFHSTGLDGMGQWMRLQSQEETAHAMKLFDHIVERGGAVTLPALDKPKAKWTSPLAAFKDAYKHEQFITSCIDKLAALAEKEKDRAAGILLQWFVAEQVEEEANASKIVDTLERLGDSGNGLIMLDVQLGKRGAGED